MQAESFTQTPQNQYRECFSVRLISVRVVQAKLIDIQFASVRLRLRDVPRTSPSANDVIRREARWLSSSCHAQSRAMGSSDDHRERRLTLESASEQWADITLRTRQQRKKKRLVVCTTSRLRIFEEVRRLLLLCSLLSSWLSGWLSSCNFLRGLLSSFLCHSTFLQKKFELEWPSCRSLPGLKTNRNNHRPKHQIIYVPMTKTMQIPFFADDRLEVPL